MKKVKVSAVSYLNTAPFVYGLKHSPIAEYIDLSLDTPAVCAARLANKDADLGLVPVAVIPTLSNYHIISDYCIGASGKVRTVVLCSNSPIDEIQHVFLDNESRTSAMLSRVLMHKYWNINPVIEQINSQNDINKLSKNTGYVLIGDKVFKHAEGFNYVYDLADTWQLYMNLPFVFAAWTSVTELSNEFQTMFNDALAMGIKNISAAINERLNLPTDAETAVTYLTENIDYKFDNNKKKALIEFWNLALEEVKSKVRS